MKASHKKILTFMQEREEATRPQMAKGTGLSLVAVNSAVAELCELGKLVMQGSIPSGGGRPAYLYRFNSAHGRHALVSLQKEGPLLQGKLEVLDLQGLPIWQKEGRFAYIEEESLDGWLDEATTAGALKSILLFIPGGAPIAMRRHLQERYRCRVRTPATATILATRKENVATLCLPPGQGASCAVFRNGKIQECGNLGLLPLPIDWAEVDHSDHTMQEETVAKLLQIITCMLSPESIILHTPAWSSKLMERIRFNTGTKLRGSLPPIRFLPLTAELMVQAMRRYAAAWL